MVQVQARTCEGCGKPKGCIPIAGGYWHLKCWRASERSVEKIERPADLIAAVDALRGPGGRRHKLPPGECKYCDGEKGSFHPSHDASSGCESGKHNHCTCDSCF